MQRIDWVICNEWIKECQLIAKSKPKKNNYRKIKYLTMHTQILKSHTILMGYLCL